MKTIGLLGGMSWKSSLEYYRIINEETQRLLGGAHSAKCLIYSFNFQEIEDILDRNNMAQLAGELIAQASNLKKAGAAFLVICTNTMHIFASEIEAQTGLEVLHIAEVTGAKIAETGCKKVALLGTSFTMQSTFYRDILKEKYDIELIVPEAKDREFIHGVIFNELVVGIINDSSRKRYIEIIGKLAAQDADGVVLGCTEIPLLIGQEDVAIPVFDTTELHALAAVHYALTE